MAAAVNVVHPEVTQFAIDRFTFEVIANRLTITTTKETFVAIMEDVLALFAAHSRVTPAAFPGRRLASRSSFIVLRLRKRGALDQPLRLPRIPGEAGPE